MTLPFSDKPEKSSIYQDLKTKTLDEITDANFDAFKARLFAEGVNGLEDEYRRLALLEFVTGKFTAPNVTGTMQNLNVTDTTGSGNPNGILFQPDVGQTWVLCGAATGTLNAGRADLTLSDGTVNVKIGQETSTDIMFEPPGIAPVYITNEVYLRYSFISATGNCTIKAAVMRIR